MRRHNYEIFKKDTVIGLLADCVYYCHQNSEISDHEALVMDLLLNNLYFMTLYKTFKVSDFGCEVDIPEFMKKDNLIKLERRKNEV